MDDEKIDEISLQKQTTEHLLKIGNYLASSCPPASRFYISNLGKRCPENSNFLKTKNNCQHCGSIWSKDNCTIFMKKRPHLNKKMKKLMEVDNWKKSKNLKKKIIKFCRATNKLVYACLICRHKTFYPGTKKMNPKSSRLLPHPNNTKTTNLKVKRKDWNAGLFLSPCQIDNLEKTEVSESMQDSETPVKSKEKNLCENKSPFIPENKILNVSFENKATPKTVISIPNTSTPSTLEKRPSSKKRKKTLLEQILSNEQNKKKKTSIASFLQTL